MKEKMVLISTRIPRHVYNKVLERVPEEAEANTPYCTARKQNCIVLSLVDHLPLPQGER